MVHHIPSWSTIKYHGKIKVFTMVVHGCARTEQCQNYYHDPKLRNMTHALSLSVLIALKGTNFYILINYLYFCLKFKLTMVDHGRKNLSMLVTTYLLLSLPV